MHHAEDEQNDSDLVAEDLDRADQIDRLLIGPQNERDVPDVDEVEADHQKMIHGIGERVVAVKRVEEKDTAVTVQRVCDPDGHGQSDGQVDEIALDDHVRSFRLHAIARKDRALLRARSDVRM